MVDRDVLQIIATTARKRLKLDLPLSCEKPSAVTGWKFSEVQCTNQRLAALKVRIESSYTDLIVSEVSGASLRWLIIESRSNFVATCAGPCKPARLLVNTDGKYQFQVLMHTVSQGDWDDAIIRGHVDSLQTKSGYVLCPGVPNYTAEFGEHIRYTPKNLRVWSIPFHRHDHHLCALWHKPSNRKQSPSSPLFNACSTCKSLYSNLQTTRKNEMGVSPASKMKRLEPKLACGPELHLAYYRIYVCLPLPVLPLLSFTSLYFVFRFFTLARHCFQSHCIPCSLSCFAMH